MIEKTSYKKVAEKVCPAVITIVITKDLPKIEGYYLFPFGGEKYMMPKLEEGKKNQKQKIGGGSGFIVSLDGYVITSSHVVADPRAEYTVIIEPKKKYSAKVLARNSINDIAVLKIENEKKKFPYLDLGNSDDIVLGERVVAVGNALGEFHDTLSAGIVSGLSRYITAKEYFNEKTSLLRGLIQTDAAINPGNSGGPLVNMDGKAIGVNTAAITKAENIGFAIPVNYIKKDLDQVKKYGKIKIPFLGVKYILLNEEISGKNKLPFKYGALIVRETLGEEAVIKNSAADEAGLKEYDIVLNCNGEKITQENPLANILQKYKIGEEVILDIYRNKKRKNIKTKLKEKK